MIICGSYLWGLSVSDGVGKSLLEKAYPKWVTSEFKCDDPEAYSAPSQTAVNYFPKSSIFDVWLGFEYAWAMHIIFNIGAGYMNFQK